MTTENCKNKPFLKRNGYSGLFRLVVEILVFVIIVWTFTQVRDHPSVFATKTELARVETRIKADIEQIIAPMRTQLTQIYTHLLDEKE